MMHHMEVENIIANETRAKVSLLTDGTVTTRYRVSGSHDVKVVESGGRLAVTVRQHSRESGNITVVLKHEYVCETQDARTSHHIAGGREIVCAERHGRGDWRPARLNIVRYSSPSSALERRDGHVTVLDQYFAGINLPAAKGKVHLVDSADKVTSRFTGTSFWSETGNDDITLDDATLKVKTALKSVASFHTTAAGSKTVFAYEGKMTSNSEEFNTVFGGRQKATYSVETSTKSTKIKMPKGNFNQYGYARHTVYLP